jgi:fumigallin biosynthesis monooxygenase-like protein
MEIIHRRVSAEIEGDFVVFLIGARVNRWWKLPFHLWFGATMPKMIAELENDPASGFLGHQSYSFGIMVQYWRSVEQLVAYARSRDEAHYPYWVKFNKLLGSSGDIGIWHETFIVRAGQYEAIYNHMPLYGLGKVGRLLDSTGRRASATGRLGRSDGTDAPLTPAGEEVAPAAVTPAGS